jgi:hypothetical protein
LVPPDAWARAIKINSCVVTIGRFCPVETLGLVVATAAFVALLGWPLNWFGNHLRRRGYETHNAQLVSVGSFMARYSLKLTLLGIGLAALVFIL